jgi:hypothetical protein
LAVFDVPRTGRLVPSAGNVKSDLTLRTAARITMRPQGERAMARIGPEFVIDGPFDKVIFHPYRYHCPACGEAAPKEEKRGKLSRSLQWVVMRCPNRKSHQSTHDYRVLYIERFLSTKELKELFGVAGAPGARLTDC